MKLRTEEENKRYIAFNKRRKKEHERVWYLSIILMITSIPLSLFIFEPLVLLFPVSIIMLFLSIAIPFRRWFDPYHESEWNVELKESVADKLKIKEKIRGLYNSTLITDGENNYIISKTFTGKYEVFHDPNIGDFVRDRNGNDIVTESFTEALLRLYEVVSD